MESLNQLEPFCKISLLSEQQSICDPCSLPEVPVCVPVFVCVWCCTSSKDKGWEVCAVCFHFGCVCERRVVR